MKLARVCSIVLAVCVGTLALADGNGGLGRPNRVIGPRVLTVGDSITWGAGSPGGYRNFLEQLLLNGGYRFEFVGGVVQNSAGMRYTAHEGHGGWTIMDIVNGRTDQPSAGKLSDWMRRYQPQTVVLMAGTNDNPWESRNDRVVKYNKLLNAVYSVNRGAQVVLASIVRSDNAVSGRGQCEAMNYSIVRDVVAARKKAGYKIAFADTYTSFNTETDLYDTYHPNSNGYYKIATAIFSALKQ